MDKPSFYIIIDSLGLIMSTCSINQFKGHWLLSNALNFVKSINLKFKDDFDFATFDNLMEEDANVFFMLSCLASNIKKKSCWNFGFFFFPSRTNMKENPICFCCCWTLGLKPFILFPHLLVMSKVRQLLKNMITSKVSLSFASFS